MQGRDQKDGSAAALILLAVFYSLAACGSPSSITSRATLVGERLLEAGVSGRGVELPATRDFPDVVRVGPKLARKLDSLAHFQQAECSVSTHTGDQLKDREASHHLILNCDEFKRLGIRLRFDATLDKFHVLGFWTPFEARPAVSSK